MADQARARRGTDTSYKPTCEHLSSANNQRLTDFDRGREYLRLRSILIGDCCTRDTSEAERAYLDEICSLAEKDKWMGEAKINRVCEFWLYCGEDPSRWGSSPDPSVWEEFKLDLELRLYKYMGEFSLSPSPRPRIQIAN